MKRPGKQRGVALLVLAVILAMGAVAFLVTSLNAGTQNETIFVRKHNAEVLAQAKAALIGYVAKEVLDLSEPSPGRLPCPEAPSYPGTSNEGKTASSCDPAFAVVKTIGRLPWRTLGIDKLVDADSEPLWYVVAPAWVYNGAYPVINAGTGGGLVVDGTPDVAAVIIAPGRPITIGPNANQVAAGCQARQQARNDRGHVVGSTTNPDYRDYLECQNASSPIDATFGTAVVDNATNLVLNDQAVLITARELMSALQGPLAERMQRTVAPLLSEYSSLWPGGTFLPYATTFSTPESNKPPADHCGPSASAQTREGLLPIAPNAAGNCDSSWNGFAVSGSGSMVSCTTLGSTNVRCRIEYYTLNFLGKLLFGSSPYADVTIQATAPHGSASFRKPLLTSDIIVPGGITAQSTTLNPQTDGDARMTLVVRVAGADMCDNSLLGVVCSLLGGLGLTGSSPQADIEFPQLATPRLQGTKLSPAVVAFKAPPYDLLNPAADDPHYWFMRNEWYRYTYYAVSPNASAAAAGGNLAINGFPAANGAGNDKRFVLTLMGPPITGQARGMAAALNQYVEGANAATAALPRVFAWQVYASPGNDRIATCPFNDGAMPCN